MTHSSPGPDARPQDPEDGGRTDAQAEAAAAESATARPREGGASSVDELERSIEESRETDADAEAEPAVSREVQLGAQVERLQAEVDVQRDKWLRAMAEFENYRKRARRELESSINLARADVLKQLLEVLDNFERALDAFDQAETPPDETFVKGVRLIQDQFLKVLRDNDVIRIEAVGAPFDPNLHEAVSQMETDEIPSQHVARVVKEGYRLNDMVLRPAMVVVAQ
jgi:molecular chaperone GrpE